MSFIKFYRVDRHSGASSEVQKEEEKKFKEVGEAFSVLSDSKKKARYDSGQDLEDDGANMGGQHLGTTQGGRSWGWTRLKFRSEVGRQFILTETSLVFVFSPPDFDANNIFKAFFGGPGGFSFEGNSCFVGKQRLCS